MTDADSARTRKPRSANGVESAYRWIRDGILLGRFPPGERIIEARIADELGVSRTIVRDSIARLEAERLVEPAGNRGVAVRSMAAGEIEQLYEIRLLLEGFAARTAASRITTDELDQLARIQDELEAIEADPAQPGGEPRTADVIHAITELNNEFHRIVHVASRNGRLNEVLRNVIAVPLVFRSFYWYSSAELAEAASDHRGIIDALKSRDADAAEARMRAHVTRGLNTLLRELAKGANDRVSPQHPSK